MQAAFALPRSRAQLPQFTTKGMVKQQLGSPSPSAIPHHDEEMCILLCSLPSHYKRALIHTSPGTDRTAGVDAQVLPVVEGSRGSGNASAAAHDATCKPEATPSPDFSALLTEISSTTCLQGYLLR